MTRLRAWELLVNRGLSGSEEEARRQILAGKMRANDRPVLKPGDLWPADADVRLVGRAKRYASRGGVKLEGALERFGLDPSGMRCLDVGASTGGFTDCLLKKGARSVCALDVAYGQMDPRLRDDPRVTVFERFNIRRAAPDALPAPFDLIVADVSFISLAKVLPALRSLSRDGTLLAALVKPQFEAPRERVGKGGVVRDPEAHRRCIEDVLGAMAECGFHALAAAASPILGPKGNKEFFLLARAGGQEEAARPGIQDDVQAALDFVPSRD